MLPLEWSLKQCFPFGQVIPRTIKSWAQFTSGHGLQLRISQQGSPGLLSPNPLRYFQKFQPPGHVTKMSAEFGNRWKQAPGPGGRAQNGQGGLDANPIPMESGDHRKEVNPEEPNQSPESAVVDGEPAGGMVSRLILANSWIISLVVHLVILVTLSLISYTLQRGTEIEIDLAHSPADDPTFMIESDDDSNDGSNLDDEMEQLLAASDSAAQFEINAESFEFDTDVSLEDNNGSDDSTSNATEGLVRSERKVGNGNNAQFFGIQATGKNFVFIVDSSSSMAGSRWNNAIMELKNSLHALQQNQKFYVIFFDHQTHLMFQGRVDRFRRSRRLSMMNATEENLDRVDKWLGRLDLGNQTRPRVSFDYGLSLTPDAIFFLTDGEFSDGTYEHLMGIAAQGSNAPTIHTVAFGNQFAGRTLKEIAGRFKGKYRFVR